MSLFLSIFLLASPKTLAEETKRDAKTIAERVAQRETLLRKRMFELYRLGRGGVARMVVESRNPVDLSRRIAGARRVIERDLQEIAELQREHKDLESTHSRFLNRVRDLESLPGSGSSIDALKGRLPWPVATAHPRPAMDGLLFRTPPRMRVRSVGQGRVIFSGSMDDFGQVVLVDHGGGLTSLYAHLGQRHVKEGETVQQRHILGLVTDKPLYFALHRSAAAIESRSWFPRR